MVYFGSYINGFEILCIQKEAETPVLQKGAVQAVQDLYDVVRHDVLSINMRFDKPQSFFPLFLVLYSWEICTFVMYSPGKTMRRGICYQKRGQKVVCFRS